jgi:hypothetical protein
MKKENNLIVDRSFDFVLRISELYKRFIKSNEFVLSKQLLRLGFYQQLSAHQKRD